jgi:hypothetical protein
MAVVGSASVRNSESMILRELPKVLSEYGEPEFVIGLMSLVPFSLFAENPH